MKKYVSLKYLLNRFNIGDNNCDKNRRESRILDTRICTVYSKALRFHLSIQYLDRPTDDIHGTHSPRVDPNIL